MIKLVREYCKNKIEENIRNTDYCLRQMAICPPDSFRYARLKLAVELYLFKVELWLALVGKDLKGLDR